VQTFGSEWLGEDVSPVDVGVNLDNCNGTRKNLIFEMMPFDGQVPGAWSSEGHCAIGNFKASCIVLMNE